MPQLPGACRQHPRPRQSDAEHDARSSGPWFIVLQHAGPAPSRSRRPRRLLAGWLNSRRAFDIARANCQTARDRHHAAAARAEYATNGLAQFSPGTGEALTIPVSTQGGAAPPKFPKCYAGACGYSSTTWPYLDVSPVRRLQTEHLVLNPVIGECGINDEAFAARRHQRTMSASPN